MITIIPETLITNILGFIGISVGSGILHQYPVYHSITLGTLWVFTTTTLLVCYTLYRIVPEVIRIFDDGPSDNSDTRQRDP